MKIIFSSTLLSILMGCSHMGTPDVYTGLTQQLPVANQTGYHEMMHCLGELVDAQVNEDFDIVVGNISDGTQPTHAMSAGFLSYAGTSMARTSLSKLGSRIGVISPNAVSPDRNTLLLLGEFTELDRTIKSSGAAGAFRAFGVELELDADHAYDILSVDMELAAPNGRQLSAISLSALVDSQNQNVNLFLEHPSGDFAANGAMKFKSVGRRHSTQRLLIESGIFVLLSRFLNVDVQQCLEKPQTDISTVRSWVQTYRKMDESERVMMIQTLLQLNGFPIRKLDGKLGRQTRKAISRFQILQGEPATGQISTHLYVKLKTEIQKHVSVRE